MNKLKAIAATVLAVLAASALAAEPGAPRAIAGVPSPADCQRLLTRAPTPEKRPVQLPSPKRLVDEVSEFVELRTKTAEEVRRILLGEKPRNQVNQSSGRRS